MKSWSRLTLLNLTLVVVIVLLDSATPAGIVVGILLSVPIVLSSLADEPREVWITFGVALAGFLAAALFGAGPISPRAVWLPNRLFVILALSASCAVALVLQDRRLLAQRARDMAIRAGDLNRLLLSLLAHDLRSPLAMAIQAFDYLDAAAERGQAPDPALLQDVQARLRRNLGTVDDLLNIAQAEIKEPEGGRAVAGCDVTRELRSEVAAFEPEAFSRGKTLVVEVPELGDRCVDERVLRQAVAILVDNAIRYAVPGEIRVSALSSDSALVVRVSDGGPGLSSRSGTEPDSGSGLGLDLCRVLVSRAGGKLETVEDRPAGTTFQLTLPVRSAAHKAVRRG